MVRLTEYQGAYAYVDNSTKDLAIDTVACSHNEHGEVWINITDIEEGYLPFEDIDDIAKGELKGSLLMELIDEARNNNIEMLRLV